MSNLTLFEYPLLPRCSGLIFCIFIPPNYFRQRRALYAMREDYRQRSAYISYLVRSRQGLECTLVGLQTLLAHVKKDKNVSHGYLTTQCVLEFLQVVRRKDSSLSLEALVADFKDLDVSDEKAVLVEKYLERVYREMTSHPLWNGKSSDG